MSNGILPPPAAPAPWVCGPRYECGHQKRGGRGHFGFRLPPKAFGTPSPAPPPPPPRPHIPLQPFLLHPPTNTVNMAEGGAWRRARGWRCAGQGGSPSTARKPPLLDPRRPLGSIHRLVSLAAPPTPAPTLRRRAHADARLRAQPAVEPHQRGAGACGGARRAGCGSGGDLGRATTGYGRGTGHSLPPAAQWLMDAPTAAASACGFPPSSPPVPHHPSLPPPHTLPLLVSQANHMSRAGTVRYASIMTTPDGRSKGCA